LTVKRPLFHPLTLGSSGGEMSIIRLRQRTKLPKAELDSIIEHLEKENKN